MSKARINGDLVASNLITTDISNDRIGIGSEQPQQSLDVSGTIRATAFVKSDGSSIGGGGGGSFNELDAALFS